MKPYRTITLYSAYNSFERKLRELGIKFTKRDVFSSFWGVEFNIDKPTGKGANKLKQTINEL